MTAAPVSHHSDEKAMTQFRDLTPYSYGAADSPVASAYNIGWLALGVDFPTASPDPQFADRLWRFCKISVGQTRGLHECELCCSREANVAQRNGEELLLGSAEMRFASPRVKGSSTPRRI